MLATIQPSGLIEQRERVLARLAAAKAVYVPMQHTGAVVSVANLGNTEYFPASNALLGTIATPANLWLTPGYISPASAATVGAKYPPTGTFDRDFQEQYTGLDTLLPGERIVVAINFSYTAAPAGDAYLWDTASGDSIYGGYGVHVTSSNNIHLKYREAGGGTEYDLCSTTISAGAHSVLIDIARTDDLCTVSLWLDGGLANSDILLGLGINANLTGALALTHPGKGLAIGGRAVTSAIQTPFSNAANAKFGNFLLVRSSQLSAADVARIAMDHTLGLGELSPALDKVL